MFYSPINSALPLHRLLIHRSNGASGTCDWLTWTDSQRTCVKMNWNSSVSVGILTVAISRLFHRLQLLHLQTWQHACTTMQDIFTYNVHTIIIYIHRVGQKVSLFIKLCLLPTKFHAWWHIYTTAIRNWKIFAETQTLSGRLTWQFV